MEKEPKARGERRIDPLLVLGITLFAIGGAGLAVAFENRTFSPENMRLGYTSALALVSGIALSVYRAVPFPF